MLKSVVIFDVHWSFFLIIQWLAEEPSDCASEDPEGPHDIPWPGGPGLCVPPPAALGVLLWGRHNYQTLHLIHRPEIYNGTCWCHQSCVRKRVFIGQMDHVTKEHIHLSHCWKVLIVNKFLFIYLFIFFFTFLLWVFKGRLICVPYSLLVFRLTLDY